jgi:hypothetical protein
MVYVVQNAEVKEILKNECIIWIYDAVSDKVIKDIIADFEKTNIMLDRNCVINVKDNRVVELWTDEAYYDIKNKRPELFI